MRPQAVCIGCGKKPAELDEYATESTWENMSADDYVWSQEGTLNQENGHFLCTPCYCKAGQPSNPFPGSNWTAP